MTIQGIILVALSALCHATWNLLSKAGSEPVAFMRKALMWSTLCYAPLFAVFCFFVPYTPTYMACLLGSGVLMGLFFFALSTAYRLGDLSVAYPLARSFPILILAVTTIAYGRPPSAVGLAGVVLIVSGCFFLPMERFGLGPGGFHPPSYLHMASLWAVGAAVVTTGFSLIDKHAAVSMPAGPPMIRMIAQVNYVYVQNAIGWFTIEAVARLAGHRRRPVEKRGPLIAGLLFLVSYSLIIMAMAADPVTYVVSFRQISIVIAAVVSMIWIEKRFSTPRLIGVLVIFAGIVLIALA